MNRYYKIGGVRMDKHGYNPSIVQPPSDYPRCFLCGKTAGKLDRHELFGASNRDKSKRLGLWAYLCHSPCHLQYAHGRRETTLALKRAGQCAAMERFEWDTERFIAEFGKNYL